MPKPRVYLETTIASYLVARPSREVVIAGRQEVTRQWWSSRRNDFDLFVSEAVIVEVAAGDAELSARRIELLAEVASLDLRPETVSLAANLERRLSLPERSRTDALHIALAAGHGMDYLMTWNFKHLANAAKRLVIESILKDAGYVPPTICTPEELLEP